MGPLSRTGQGGLVAALSFGAVSWQSAARACDNQLKRQQGFAMKWFLMLAVVLACAGCAVVAVADAVVTTGAVVVKTGVKAAGAVVGAVLPD
jgi:hypothetical protein